MAVHPYEDGDTMSAVVTVAGYVAADPETKTIGSGKNVTTLSIPSNVKTKEGETTNWYRVSFWGKPGEVIAAHVKKGAFLVVSGRLTVRDYEAKGEKRYALEVDASDFTFGPKPKDAPEQSSGQDDIPF